MSVLSLARRGERQIGPPPNELLLDGDVLTIKADHEALDALVTAGLEFVAEDDPADGAGAEAGDMELVEAVVGFQSLLAGRTARGVRLRRRFGVNLLAVSRKGFAIYESLGNVRLQVGDVVLLQGSTPRASRRPCRALAACRWRSAACAWASRGVSCWPSSSSRSRSRWQRPACWRSRSRLPPRRSCLSSSGSSAQPRFTRASTGPSSSCSLR